MFKSGYPKLSLVYYGSGTIEWGFSIAGIDRSCKQNNHFGKYWLRWNSLGSVFKSLSLIRYFVPKSRFLVRNMLYVANIQWNFSGSNTDGWFSTAVSNSFLSPLEENPKAANLGYFTVIFSFIQKWCIVCIVYEAILMRTHNIHSRLSKSISLLYPLGWRYD